MEIELKVEKRFLNSVKELDVYKRAYQLSLDIHKASLTFPKIEQYALADQARRCSKSICANLAEGFGKQRHAPAEFKRFISISAGSCAEMSVWLDYSFDLGYIAIQQFEAWQSEYAVIARMLNRLRDKVNV